MVRRSECYSLLLRLHAAGFVQNSFYTRNILVQPGPLTVPPAERDARSPSFRIIDFGRARSWRDILAQKLEEHGLAPEGEEGMKEGKEKEGEAGGKAGKGKEKEEDEERKTRQEEEMKAREEAEAKRKKRREDAVREAGGVWDSQVMYDVRKAREELGVSPYL